MVIRLDRPSGRVLWFDSWDMALRWVESEPAPRHICIRPIRYYRRSRYYHKGRPYGPEFFTVIEMWIEWK